MSAIRALLLLSGASILAALSLTEAQANKERVLYSFTDGTDSALPEGVIRDDRGVLYGTALGDRSNCIVGTAYCGAVFRLTPKGKETTLYTFEGGGAGSSPKPGLIADSKGNLYGAAANVVFKISRDSKEHVLHDFEGFGDGLDPQGYLILDSAGNLYGTTYKGGTANYGTIYRMGPHGKTTILYSFPGGVGGAYPNAGLYRDISGNLYGTTLLGGHDCDATGQGCGIVFELTSGGTAKVLHAFMGGGGDGANPTGSVTMDASGATLYGATRYGGVDCYGFGFDCGTLFKVTTSGDETVLHLFTGADGALPDNGLIMDAAGNLYGAAEGGAESSGVIFEFTATGQMRTLYSFTGGSDGASPSSHLAMDDSGNLYGATRYGGAFGYGTVFKMANR